MALIVDGYNLAYAGRQPHRPMPNRGGHICPPESRDPSVAEKARNRVLRMLLRYQRARPGPITVVFDGGPGGEKMPRFQHFHGIEIIYSPLEIEADDEIRNLIANHPDPASLRVITSDHAVSLFATRHKAHVTDSLSFIREVEQLAGRDDATPEDEPLEKYEPTSDETDAWMKLFGGEPEENLA